jgi:hypothetical protein
MRSHVPISVLTRLGWFLSAGPALALLLLVSLAIHVRLAIGRFPAYGTYNPLPPDPVGAHDRLALFGFAFAAASLLCWPVVMVALCRRGRSGVALSQAAVFATGLAALILVHLVDPFGFIAWFWD